MNRPIPKLGSVESPSEISEKLLRKFTHIALPLVSQEGKLEIDLSKKEIKQIAAIYNLDFDAEIKKFGNGITGKAGEVIDIPVLNEKSNNEVMRVLLVGVGAKTQSDIRKAGAAIGRKVKASKAKVLSLIAKNAQSAQIHFIASALATYSWSQKTAAQPETP